MHSTRAGASRWCTHPFWFALSAVQSCTIPPTGCHVTPCLRVVALCWVTCTRVLGPTRLYTHHRFFRAILCSHMWFEVLDLLLVYLYWFSVLCSLYLPLLFVPSSPLFCLSFRILDGSCIKSLPDGSNGYGTFDLPQVSDIHRHT